MAFKRWHMYLKLRCQIKCLINLYQYQKQLYTLNLLCKNRNIKNFYDFECQRLKKSDTIFILGSGPSINDIKSSEWHFIQKHDTFGFNFWHIHEFIPSFYSFEFSKHENAERFSAKIHNLNKINDKYHDTKIICKSENIHDLEKIEQYLTSDLKNRLFYFYTFTNSYTFYETLPLLNKIGIFKERNTFKYAYHARGSVVFLIYFALVMGYRKIVLCGVDLNNPDYFYEYEAAKYVDSKFKIPPRGHSGNIHKTNDPERHELTMEKIIYFLNEKLIKPKGVNLYVYSKKSALYPVLPIYQIEY